MYIYIYIYTHISTILYYSRFLILVHFHLIHLDLAIHAICTRFSLTEFGSIFPWDWGICNFMQIRHASVLEVLRLAVHCCADVLQVLPLGDLEQEAAVRRSNLQEREIMNLVELQDLELGLLGSNSGLAGDDPNVAMLHLRINTATYCTCLSMSCSCL